MYIYEKNLVQMLSLAVELLRLLEESFVRLHFGFQVGSVVTPHHQANAKLLSFFSDNIT